MDIFRVMGTPWSQTARIIEVLLYMNSNIPSKSALHGAGSCGPLISDSAGKKHCTHSGHRYYMHE